MAIKLMMFALTFVEEYIMSISRDSTKDLVNKAGVSFVNNLSFDIQPEKIKEWSEYVHMLSTPPLLQLKNHTRFVL